MCEACNFYHIGILTVVVDMAMLDIGKSPATSINSAEYFMLPNVLRLV